MLPFFIAGLLLALRVRSIWEHIASLQEAGPLRMWFQPGMDGARFFRPASSLLLAADLRLWGHAPLGFHITNLVLHLLKAALVGLLARRIAPRNIDPTARRTIAWAAAWIHNWPI